MGYPNQNLDTISRACMMAKTGGMHGSDDKKVPAKRKPVERMTVHEIALAFCKECRGWKGRTILIGTGISTFILSRGDYISFDPTKLDGVMDVVREWLKPNGHHPVVPCRVITKEHTRLIS